MKTLHSLILCAGLGLTALGFAASAAAEPPPGHPTPDAAMRMMQPAGSDGMRGGKVISHIDANEYTYVEVSEGGKSVWLAAPAVALKDGDSIRFANGMVMRDFYSKFLKRTFPEVIFTGGVEVAK